MYDIQYDDFSFTLFSGFIVSMAIGSYGFDYPRYGNIEIMYIWSGIWSTFFGIVTGAIGIKASSYPIFKLNKIESLHRTFSQLVSHSELNLWEQSLYSGFHHSVHFYLWNTT